MVSKFISHIGTLHTRTAIHRRSLGGVTSRQRGIEIEYLLVFNDSSMSLLVCNITVSAARCCVDINECDVSSTCPVNFVCFNTYGSFRCISVVADAGKCCSVSPFSISQSTDPRNSAKKFRIFCARLPLILRAVLACYRHFTREWCKIRTRRAVEIVRRHLFIL